VKVEPEAAFAINLKITVRFLLVVPSKFFYAAPHNNTTSEIGMWKAALAGVVLATTGATFCLAQDFEYSSATGTHTEQRAPTVTAGHIARLKAALKLTPEQHRFWPAVESALRRLSRRDAGGTVSAAVGQANAIRRVASAARPLIGALTEKQKEDGMRAIRALGFSSLASAL
jgi:hypothetical protein